MQKPDRQGGCVSCSECRNPTVREGASHAWNPETRPSGRVPLMLGIQKPDRQGGCLRSTRCKHPPLRSGFCLLLAAFCLLSFRSHMRKQNHVADRMLISEQHD